MKKSHLVEESKKRLSNKLKDLQEAEDEIHKIINGVTVEAKDGAKQLLEITSKSKFLNQVPNIFDNVDKTLSQLFTIKVLITAKLNGSSPSSDSSDETSSDDDDDDGTAEKTEDLALPKADRMKKTASPSRSPLKSSQCDSSGFNESTSHSLAISTRLSSLADVSNDSDPVWVSSANKNKTLPKPGDFQISASSTTCSPSGCDKTKTSILQSKSNDFINVCSENEHDLTSDKTESYSTISSKTDELKTSASFKSGMQTHSWDSDSFSESANDFEVPKSVACVVNDLQCAPNVSPSSSDVNAPFLSVVESQINDQKIANIEKKVEILAKPKESTIATELQRFLIPKSTDSSLPDLACEFSKFRFSNENNPIFGAPSSQKRLNLDQFKPLTNLNNSISCPLSYKFTEFDQSNNSSFGKVNKRNNKCLKSKEFNRSSAMMTLQSPPFVFPKPTPAFRELPRVLDNMNVMQTVLANPGMSQFGSPDSIGSSESNDSISHALNYNFHSFKKGENSDCIEGKNQTKTNFKECAKSGQTKSEQVSSTFHSSETSALYNSISHHFHSKSPKAHKFRSPKSRNSDSQDLKQAIKSTLKTLQPKNGSMFQSGTNKMACFPECAKSNAKSLFGVAAMPLNNTNCPNACNVIANNTKCDSSSSIEDLQKIERSTRDCQNLKLCLLKDNLCDNDVDVKVNQSEITPVGSSLASQNNILTSNATSLLSVGPAQKSDDLFPKATLVCAESPSSTPPHNDEFLVSTPSNVTHTACAQSPSPVPLEKSINSFTIPSKKTEMKLQSPAPTVSPVPSQKCINISTTTSQTAPVLARSPSPISSKKSEFFTPPSNVTLICSQSPSTVPSESSVWLSPATSQMGSVCANSPSPTPFQKSGVFTCNSSSITPVCLQSSPVAFQNSGDLLTTALKVAPTDPGASQKDLNAMSSPPNSMQLENVQLKLKSTLNSVLVTEIQSPWSFWIQAESNEFKALDNKLQYYGESSKIVLRTPLPCVGTFCCVRSSIDHHWYRCKILKSYEDNNLKNDYVVDVLHVDYGKTEYGLPSSELRGLPKEFRDIKCQAIHCKLSQVYPKYEAWIKEDTAVFKKLTTTNKFEAVVESSSSTKPPYSVQLLSAESNLDICHKLIELTSAEWFHDTPIKNKMITSVDLPYLKLNKEYLEQSDVPFPVIDNSKSISLLVSYIESVTQIYFHQVNDSSANMWNFEESWNIWCNTQKNTHAKVEEGEVEVKTCWYIFYEATEKWYRGRILELLGNQEFLVFFVDYGDKIVVHLNCLLPFTRHSKKVPALAISLSLYGIIPNYSEKVKNRIEELVDFDKPLCAEVMSSTPNDLTGRKLGVLLWKEESGKRVCINSVLLKEGIVKSHIANVSSYFNSLSSSSEEESNNSSDGKLDNWDPMFEDFESELNTYQLDKDDPGVALMGFKARDIAVCRQYNQGRCYRGDACPFKHTSYENSITSAEEFATIVDGKTMPSPKPGSAVIVNISACRTPAHFYVVFPYGCKSFQELTTNRDEITGKVPFEERSLFNEELTKFYNKMKFHGNRGLLPSVGSLVVVKSLFQQEWCRAKVLEVDSENKEIDVFYVDCGYYETVHFKHVHEIDPRFAHFPYQAIECFIPYLQPVGGFWSQESMLKFEQLCSAQMLIAYILGSDDTNVLDVDLYGTSEKELNIGQELVKLNYAIKLPPVPVSSSPKIMLKSSFDRCLVPG